MPISLKNLLPTDDQVKMRELVEALATGERPLTDHELIPLQHFVEIVRHEIVERDSIPAATATTLDGRTIETSPAVGGYIRRVNYYRLNERGLKMLHKWQRGGLDSLLD